MALMNPLVSIPAAQGLLPIVFFSVGDRANVVAGGTYPENHQKQALGMAQANVEAIVEFDLCFLSRKKREGPVPNNLTAIWVESLQ